MPSKVDNDFSESGVASAWDQNAESWIPRVRAGYDVYREYFNNPAILEFIGDVKGREILDAGCGEGYQTRILARRGARMTGIDISDRMIESAQAEERREPLGIEYRRTSFTNLSMFRDGSFDAVVSFMALMDGPGFPAVMGGFERILRPGAPLIFSIVHPISTRGFGWIRDDTGREKFTVSDYFDESPFVDKWKFSNAPDADTAPNFTVPYFRATLSHYINSIIRAGLTIDELHEPRPTQAACREHPFLQRWRDHAPLFLYVRALKPRR
ncbi:MAG TPA: class I SAM-dependent methyltransferase [Candidatus Binataceae bacterium]|nr:class I SAM-dependent methyltransferase [Candidatus Binataceae bacterium]